MFFSGQSGYKLTSREKKYNLFELIQHLNFIRNIPKELQRKDGNFARKFCQEYSRELQWKAVKLARKFYKEYSRELQLKDVKLARKLCKEIL